jgi:RNA polymerase sigma factor (sigma-70 family)
MYEPSLGEDLNVSAETQTREPGWSQAPDANLGRSGASPLRGTSDEQLARAAGRGTAAAFEALYERHHHALLSFSRHMVGSPHDAEDVVQHTFLAADRLFRSGTVPKAVRAWLYTVARNRCITILRMRREEPGLPDAGAPSTANLADEVEQREELRDLLVDLRELPDDQRAALLLSEMGELGHAEVAKVIGVRPGKVKALVFQAREALMAGAAARAIPCRSIREELAVARGPDLRRRHLRNHLARCPDCTAYAARVRAQRASLMILLPVAPTAALREGVLGALAGGTASAAATGAGAGLGMLAAKSTAAKLLAIAAVGGTAATGGTVAVTAVDGPDRPRAESSAPSTPVRERESTPPREVTVLRRNTPAAQRGPAPARRDSSSIAPRGTGTTPPGLAKKGPGATPPGQARNVHGATPPGQAKKIHGATPPGQTRKGPRSTPPGRADATSPGRAKSDQRTPSRRRATKNPAAVVSPPPKTKPTKTRPAQSEHRGARTEDASPPAEAATPPGQARKDATPAAASPAGG